MLTPPEEPSGNILTNFSTVSTSSGILTPGTITINSFVAVSSPLHAKSVNVTVCSSFFLLIFAIEFLNFLWFIRIFRHHST